MSKKKRRETEIVPQWVVSMNATDGSYYYGPFDDPNDAAQWVRETERDNGYIRSWSLLSLRSPW